MIKLRELRKNLFTFPSSKSFSDTKLWSNKSSNKLKERNVSRSKEKLEKRTKNIEKMIHEKINQYFSKGYFLSWAKNISIKVLKKWNQITALIFYLYPFDNDFIPCLIFFNY